MTTIIKPIELYQILSKPKYKGFESKECPYGQQRAGEVQATLQQRPHFIFYTDHQQGLSLRIDRDGKTIFQNDQKAIATDNNGNGIQENTDTGNFNELQQFLAQVRRFAYSTETFYPKCVKPSGPPSSADRQLSAALLGQILTGKKFESFNETPKPCPSGQNFVKGFSISRAAVLVGGLYEGDIIVYNHSMQTDARITLPSGKTTVRSYHCEDSTLTRFGQMAEERDGDGVVDVGDQSLYDAFMASLREFVQHPEKFSKAQCGPCP